jgi:Common central domain of tyrosinase
MATVRKSTSAMQPADWDRLIDAINKLHGTGAARPAYRDFVKVHSRAMSNVQAMATWRIHSMQGMIGVNFLAWHRQMLIRFEQRLQQVHASVFIPYWDWIANPAPPAQISDPALLDSWSVDRDSDLNLMPSSADVEAVKARNRFTPFQLALETGPHNAVHRAIGGDMVTGASPTDPLFYMHHANVDRLWYEWQERHPAQNPPNMDEVLKPAWLSVPVSSVVDRTNLPYSYT